MATSKKKSSKAAEKDHQQVGVRIVCGILIPTATPPPTAQNVATDLLRAAAQKDFAHAEPGVRKKAAYYASKVGVFPVPGRSLCVAGFSGCISPLTWIENFSVGDGAPMAMSHPVNPLWLNEGPSYDDEGNVGFRDRLLDLLKIVMKDKAWPLARGKDADALAVPLVAKATRPKGKQATSWFLLSEDGRDGDIVRGVTQWSAGATPSAGKVRTWSRDIGKKGHARVTGISVASVSRTSPVTILPSHWASEFPPHEMEPMTEVVNAVMKGSVDLWLVA